VFLLEKITRNPVVAEIVLFVCSITFAVQYVRFGIATDHCLG